MVYFFVGLQTTYGRIFSRVCSARPLTLSRSATLLKGRAVMILSAVFGPIPLTAMRTSLVSLLMSAGLSLVTRAKGSSASALAASMRASSRSFTILAEVLFFQIPVLSMIAASSRSESFSRKSLL